MTALLCMLLVCVGSTSIPLSPTLWGLATGYIDVWEHSGGDRHIDVNWSPIIEDLYSLELGALIHRVWVRLLGSRLGEVSPQDGAQYDPTVPSSPPPNQSAPLAIPFTLHSQTEVVPTPIIVPTPTSEDPHACMDRLDKKLRQLRSSDRPVTWDDFDGLPVASLPAKFRMPEIERYTGIGCPCIHLRLYSTIMRAHGLDEERVRGIETEARGVDHLIYLPLEGEDFIGLVWYRGGHSQRIMSVPQLPETHPSYPPQQYRPRAPRPTFDHAYMPQTLVLPYYATQGIERPPVSYTATG
ncbi:hypothetical protein CK203_065328 [Vitis vinifera]|uniref:Uncharacterized protein n=1 Tax=Vitis vinifera TaxID=29760 RepID=A0A438FNQ5_VITVI|nr:hypothetical protein CK203_065328 [Vitis vinifera]